MFIISYINALGPAYSRDKSDPSSEANVRIHEAPFASFFVYIEH